MPKPLVIVGCRDGIAADYAAHVMQRGAAPVVIAERRVLRGVSGSVSRVALAAADSDELVRVIGFSEPCSLIVFIEPRLAKRWRAVLDRLVDATARCGVKRIVVVSSFAAHVGDRAGQRAEDDVLALLRRAAENITVLRPSHVLSRRSAASTALRRYWGFLRRLIPSGARTCWLREDELLLAIDDQLATSAQTHRLEYTLLGANRPWREVLDEQADVAILQRAVAVLLLPLQWLGAGLVARGLFSLAARLRPSLRRFDFDTLYPASRRELLALYNRYTFKRVKIVGYNNGVVHFGQTHPGKTIVSTVRTGNKLTVHGAVAKLDSGMTLRRVIDHLAQLGKELYVVPNYSYVSIGTCFFVPIHGSASEYCTVAETIDKVLLYDPQAERVRVASRGDALFDQSMYDQSSDLLLLRLYLRVREKVRYYVQRDSLKAPAGADVFNVFRDPRPANIELRKSRAAADEVDVLKYYVETSPDADNALELPRDSIGRVWDRLEENPVSAALFHGLVRRFGFHVELFLTESEFVRFWETHRELPIAKLQFRFLRRDGMPRSPFGQHDCVSADLFMLRRHRQQFETYLRETFREVRFNPGKHSM